MVEKNILFTIITPIYNGELYLKKMIESVINQEYGEFELLLINDGSTDNSLNICKEYAEKDKRINVINKSNSGVSNTRNIGIKMAKGKYICFLDADDYLEPNYLSEFKKMIDKNNNCLYCCGIKRIKENVNDNNQKNFESDYYKEKHNIVFTNYGGYIWNKVFIKDILINKNIFFKEDIYMCEDMVFTVEYINYIEKIVVNNKKLYNYRILDLSASKKLSNKNWFTIFKSFDFLLNLKIKDSEFVSNCIFFKYYYYCFGLYRLKHIDDEEFRIKWKKEINKRNNEYSKEKQYLSIYKRIKIFIYKTFGFILFKIKG